VAFSPNGEGSAVWQAFGNQSSAIDTASFELLPAIQNVRITPHRFAVSQSPAHIGRGFHVATLTFMLSVRATVSITIDKGAGTVLHAGLPAGPMRFPITGRIGARMLPPGRYSVQLMAMNGAGSSKPVRASFVVER
jgi:hypothetical protein